jgi:hypothetical protein
MAPSILVACPSCGRRFPVTPAEVRAERIVPCPDGHPIQLRDLTHAGEYRKKGWTSPTSGR